jgi:ATP-dependent 26S proteasome regulatory subunit
VKRTASYRGKVISLETMDRYSGHGGPVRVHKLRSVRREEVILPEKTLQLLDRNIGDFIRQREQLRKLGMPIKKGLLFYGPPGTGKTHTIHYLASQLPDHTTLLITAEQVGLLDHYFQLARFLQPTMVVIEDVDLIARAREQMHGPCEESLLNKLLNEMDGLREDSAVLFVLTTNRPEQLEVALASRPGRIDQAIEFPLPDDRGRRQLVRLYSCGLPVSDEVVELIVRSTERGSAAFIKELMRRTAQFHIQEGKEGSFLRADHVNAALEEMLFSGGSLNAKLLGASEVGRGTIQ